MNSITHKTGADVARAQKTNASDADVLNETPLLFFIDDFVGGEDCEVLINLAKDKMTRAVVSGAQGGVESQGRTNSVAWVAHNSHPKTLAIAQKVADLLELPLSHAESFQVIHYKPGAEYRAHFDAFDITTERGQRTMQKGGQRITTTLCYLNEVEAGGSTGFREIGVEVAPKMGRLVVFNNCEGDAIKRSELSLHSGNPVEAGEKWAFNLWFRQYPTTHNPIAASQA